MSYNENDVKEKQELDEYFKKIDAEHDRKGAGVLVVWLLVCAFIAVCAGIFIGVYVLRTQQLDDYVNGLEAADGSSSVTESTEMPALDMVKIGIDGKTYTIPELATLDEIPTVVDVIIIFFISICNCYKLIIRISCWSCNIRSNTFSCGDKDFFFSTSTVSFS